MKAIIGGKKEIAFSKLIVVPHFLRFNQVTLAYQIGSQHINQKCDSFRVHLSELKATLNDSSVIHFDVKINQLDYDPAQFQSHLTARTHIRCIVSICDSSRGYSFLFRPYTFGDLIASYLEMPAISRSSFVSIAYPSTFTLKTLPVEAISNWLNRERNAMDQNQRERCIKLPPAYYSIIKEICDSLKRVAFNFEYLVFLVRYLIPLHWYMRKVPSFLSFAYQPKNIRICNIQRRIQGGKGEFPPDENMENQNTIPLFKIL